MIYLEVFLKPACQQANILSYQKKLELYLFLS